MLSSPVPELSESEWETDVTEDEQEQVMIREGVKKNRKKVLNSGPHPPTARV